MPQSVQQFLADSAKQAAEDLIAALDRIPEDKRAWSAMGDARTALDQVAECALLNGTSAEVIVGRAWPENFDYAAYTQEKTKLAQDLGAVKSLLEENAAKVVAAILTLSDDELGMKIQTQFGSMSWTQIASYPYWNMSYHQGQINYIAAMLGCLQ
jgi:hypothetical protein